MASTLADSFEAHRGHLRAVAYRMLGSHAEADDAVQEAWLRLARADTTSTEIANLGGWLTTVIARICLDMLRARTSRRETDAPLDGSNDAATAATTVDHAAAAELQLADSIGIAMLVVLELLQPAERIAFVLHDMFDLPFEDIGPIVGRTPTATRQLASRARRRVQGASSISDADRTRQSEVVTAFLAASRDGNFEALLGLLDPHVILRADAMAVAVAATNPGAPRFAAEMHGKQAVADSFKGRARGAVSMIVDGIPQAGWAPGGTPRGVFQFTIDKGAIIAIDVIVDPARIAELDIVLPQPS